MNKLPLVSIIIPVYNGSNFLKDAIKSALSQEYKEVEILVINDGSTDNGATERIAKEFGSKIRYFNKKNGGVASALNFGINKMKGEYFSWLSHDDRYLPNKISSQIMFIKKNKLEKCIIYSSYYYIDDRGEILDDKSQSIAFDNKIKTRLALILGRISLHGCTMLVPKDCFEVSGLFDEDLKTTQDYDLWFKMANHFRFCYLNNQLVESRNHLEQGSISMKEIVYEEGNELYIFFLKSLKSSEILESGLGLTHFYFIFWNRMARIGYITTINHLITKVKDDICNYKFISNPGIIILLPIMIVTKELALLKRALLRIFCENTTK